MSLSLLACCVSGYASVTAI